MTSSSKSSSGIETAILSEREMRLSILNCGAITPGWWHKGGPLILGFKVANACFTDTGYEGEFEESGSSSGHLGLAQKDELNCEASKRIGCVEQGIDQCFCFDHDRNRDANLPIAKSTASLGLALEDCSELHWVQFYSEAKPLNPFRTSSVLCIEPSGDPNAPSIPSVPSATYSPEKPFQQTLKLELPEGRYEF